MAIANSAGSIPCTSTTAHQKGEHAVGPGQCRKEHPFVAVAQTGQRDMSIPHHPAIVVRCDYTGGLTPRLVKIGSASLLFAHESRIPESPITPCGLA